MRARTRRLGVALVVASGVAACGGEGGGAPREGAPAGPMVAPARELERLHVAEWRLAWLGDGAGGDPVGEALEAGRFEYPPRGRDGDGVTWSTVRPEDGVTLGELPAGYGYAAAAIWLPDPTHLVVRAEHALAVWVNGAMQPGDVYGSGRMRVPGRWVQGTNLVVARLLGGRGAPQLELWATPDEVVLNTSDVTAPDLVAGDASEQWLGLPLLSFAAEGAQAAHAPLGPVTAHVEESEHFEASATTVPGLARGAATQLAFRLVPKAPWPAAGAQVPVRLRVESASLRFAYARELQLGTVAAAEPYRRTRRSAADGSVQYHGVRPPVPFEPSRAYALVLSLHGAGVEGIGQAQAYSAKDWAYLVAPTNRRPFGFDWEEWGRLDGIEALDDAMESFSIDPTRVYLTGHSMGGHGTWQLGVHHPGRFAVIAPSAGWGSFYSYTGRARPQGAFARAQAASDTHAYVKNLARRGVYVLHGSADDNVPVREGREMSELAASQGAEVVYHEQPGAGHWWDGDASPGADCVDWPPLFELMRSHTLDPHELDFDFTSPGPWVNPAHSFVTLRAAANPLEDCGVASVRTGDTVTVTTRNVRSMTLDGHALRARGVVRAIVDRDAMAVPDGPLAVGPEAGKAPGRHGPFHTVFFRPFCFVLPEGGGAAYAEYAAWLSSTWALIGNGSACAVGAAQVDEALRAERNLIWLGVESAALPAGVAPPLSWDAEAIRAGGERFEDAALALAFPDGERLGAAVFATAGAEALLFALQPFSSGAAIPDWLVWSAQGGRGAGFFDAEWRLAGR